MILKFALPSFLVAAFAFTIIKGQTDLSDTHEGEDPPNIKQLTGSVNALLGRPPSEQRDQGLEIFELSRIQDEHTYNTFKELYSPNFHTYCEHNEESRSNYWATSESSLESSKWSQSIGFDQSVDLGITAPFKGIEATAQTTIRNALVFGNSKSSMTSFLERKNGFTHSISSYSASALYSYKVDYDEIGSLMSWTPRFIKECKNLGTDPNNHTLLKFFEKVGTHGLEYVVFGKQCTGSVFMEGGRTDEEYKSFSNDKSNYDLAFKWFNAKGSSDEKKDETDTSTRGFDIKFTNMRCVGDLAKNTSCGGGMNGNGEDSPAIVEWSFKPIWEMDVPGLSQLAKKNMKSLVEEFVAVSTRCSVAHCNGRGVCASSTSNWNNLPTTIDLDTFFDTDRCFCFTNVEGEKCNQAPKPSSKLTLSAWTGFLNDYDRPMTYDGKVHGKQGAISSMHSEHSNKWEDRRFSMQTKVPIGNPRVHYKFFGSNEYDKNFYHVCGPNSVLTSLTSRHHDYHEDRRTSGSCGKFEGWETDECYWTQWENDYDKVLTYRCPEKFVFAGMKSTHSGSYEDRKFAFYICEFKRAELPPLPPGDIKQKESETSVY